MAKVIIYTQADGAVAVCRPAPKFLALFASEDEGLSAVIAKSVPADAADVEIVDEGTVPDDRTFRGAWVQAGGAIGCDMEKARAIHMNRIRAVRDKELARLDIEQLKGNDVAAEKQRLRDTPQTFDLSTAETPEALKALWPAELPRP